MRFNIGVYDDEELCDIAPMDVYVGVVLARIVVI